MFLLESFLNYFYKSEMETTRNLKERLSYIRVGMIVGSLKVLLAEIYPDVANVKEKLMDWLCERAILTSKKKTH